MLEKIKGVFKKAWKGMLSLAPDDKLAKGVFYALLVLFVSAIGYCWISHFIANI
jgi:hypothetical protein